MEKRLRIALSLIVLLAIALTSVAFARGLKNPAMSKASSSPRVAAASHAGKKAAVKHKDDEKEGKEADGEENDDAHLTASLTPAQAVSAALAARPGTASKTELENENGKAVYGVDVLGSDGKKYDVTVDANTGRVLKVEGDDEDGEQGEGGETEDD